MVAILDNGQHILIGAYTELLGLMRLRRRSVRRGASRAARVALRGRLCVRALWLPAPLGLLGGLLALRKVSIGERFWRLPLHAVVEAHQVSTRAGRPGRRLLESHGQSGAIGEYLWRPLCVAGAEHAARRRHRRKCSSTC
jgi:hypothetical protein